MIYIYNLLGILLIPLIKINLKFRLYNNKEAKDRYKERYGISNTTKLNQKRVIWIHASSVGEFKSSDYFINKYHEKFLLIITTTTLSAANYATTNYGNKIVHQFAPLDVTLWVKKFLKRWNPELVLWIESDLWPSTLHLLKKNKIKTIYLNARLSPQSAKKWKIINFFYNDLMHCFYKVFAQSHNDLNRIQNLSTKKIYYIGNLKLTNTMQINPRNKNIQLKTNKNKITIMLASTHENEEEKLLPLLKNLLNQFPNINLLIAPRHPERSHNILSLCEKFNLSAELESKKPINEKKIIIIDSFGILINYFKIADIVFLGGSLVSAGGHNPIEPANQECAILTGKQIFNWQNIYDDMVVENSCLKIDSLEDLEIALKDLLNNKYKIEIMKQNAFNFAKKQFVDTNILDSIVNNHMNK